MHSANPEPFQFFARYKPSNCPDGQVYYFRCLLSGHKLCKIWHWSFWRFVFCIYKGEIYHG